MKLTLTIFYILFYLSVNAQQVSGKLKFSQGQVLTYNFDLHTKVAQQAMNQAIDFEVTANAKHEYSVTNATVESTTLHHKLNSISFLFDGMGTKRSFDSGKERDLNGQFGKPVKELLSKSYDIIIDSTGKVLLAQPEKIDYPEMDDRFLIIGNMLKDVFDLVQPPAKSTTSYFAILPPGGVSVGQSWTENYENAHGKFENKYYLSSITDSVIVVQISGTSSTTTAAKFMGNDTRTIMNNKSNGTIKIDPLTGIFFEKTLVTESYGTTEGMGSSVPITSKTTISIKLQ